MPKRTALLNTNSSIFLSYQRTNNLYDHIYVHSLHIIPTLNRWCDFVSILCFSVLRLSVFVVFLGLFVGYLIVCIYCCQDPVGNNLGLIWLPWLNKGFIIIIIYYYKSDCKIKTLICALDQDNYQTWSECSCIHVRNAAAPVLTYSYWCYPPPSCDRPHQSLWSQLRSC